MSFYTNIMMVFSAGGYSFFLSTLMRTVNCEYGDYHDDGGNYYVGVNATSRHLMVPTMECWTGTHLGYVFLCVLALMAYYPLASFIYPQLQFCDKHADVKYTTSFVVLLNQAKLIVVGLVIFYSKDSDIPFVNIFSMAMFLLLAAVNHSIGPCIIAWINPMRTTTFLMAAWASATTVMLEWTKPSSTDIGTIMLWVGWGVLALTGLGLYFDPLGLYALSKEEELSADAEDMRDLFERNMRESTVGGEDGARQSLRESEVEFDVAEDELNPIRGTASTPAGPLLRRFMTKKAEPQES